MWDRHEFRPVRFACLRRRRGPGKLSRCIRNDAPHPAGTLAQGRLARLWEEGFAKFHSDVHFSYYLPTAEVALTPLYYHQADISLVHELGFYDILPYERVLNSQPLRITAATPPR